MPNNNDDKKPFIKSWIVFSGITMVILVLLIILTMNSHNKPIKYGSLSYYLSVDHQVQSFPLIGVKRANTVYEIFGGDGPSAPTITLSYISNANIKTVNAFYRNACNKLGYHFKPDESSSQIFNFTAKKPFTELSLELFPTKQGSKVRLIFFYEFEQ
ncbi:MAG TPA: hypothetical protein VEC37_05320 [Bacillota bacterium]|nr:hypothetical protein [Bacillota bacterium]